jgi:membrane-bound lytic murein transglycosylase B
MVSRKVRRRRSFVALIVIGGVVAGTAMSLSGLKFPDSIQSLSSAGTAAPVQKEEFAPPIEQAPRAPGLSDAQLKTQPIATIVDPAWIASNSKTTGIPARALAAYAGTALGLSLVKPGCHLSWNTLAGIGWVESHHGTLRGGNINADGDTTPPIFGIPLDGKNNTKAIPDSDRGSFDGTAEFDRAVGPMQIVPGTWAAWHADGNADGDEDGQNIDDAVLAAGRYLCYSGKDLSSKEGWQKALFGYNQVNKYMTDVATKAVSYAQAAGAAPA